MKKNYSVTNPRTVFYDMAKPEDCLARTNTCLECPFDDCNYDEYIAAVKRRKYREKREN